MTLDKKYCASCGQEIIQGLFGFGGMKSYQLQISGQVQTYCEICAREVIAAQRQKNKK